MYLAPLLLAGQVVLFKNEKQHGQLKPYNLGVIDGTNHHDFVTGSDGDIKT